MIESIKFTRKGWIKHLATAQKMLELMGEIFRIPTEKAMFVRKDCEDDRRDKIMKGFVKLQELIWETGAVSEKIWNESQKLASKDPDFDWYEHDELDAKLEYSFRKFKAQAKELEQLARSLYDPTAPEIVEPEVVYPGPDAPSGTEAKEDPNQLKLPLKKPEPPTVDPSKLIDFKKEQANDDTTKPDGEEGDDE